MIDFISGFILPSQDLAITISVMAIFLFAGVIKGFLGIGLPAAAMAFLILVMDPKSAISLLTLPIIFTNIIQYARCENPSFIAKKYWLFAFSIVVSIFITSYYILSYPRALLTTSIGIAMISFSLTQMFDAKFPINESRGWHIGVGLFSGVLGGLSSIWSPPIAMYLLARNVNKAEFIGATGFLLLASSLPLAAGLMLAGVMTTETVLHSLTGLFVVLVGFRIGEALRQHVSQNLFRKIVLWAFLIMGIRLVAVALL